MMTYCFGKDTHELRELVCEHGQYGSEGAKACCEEDEEGKLFFWVHRHLVKSYSEDEREGESKMKSDKDKQGFKKWEDYHS